MNMDVGIRAANNFDLFAPSVRFDNEFGGILKRL
jgi:hypothetical protein